MPRKRKSQEQNGTTDEPGPDPLPLVNTTEPNPRPTQEEKAASGEGSDGPTRGIRGTVNRHREQAPALGSHKLDHGASLGARKQDLESGGQERTSDSHAPIECNSSPGLSTVVSMSTATRELRELCQTRVEDFEEDPLSDLSETERKNFGKDAKQRKQDRETRLQDLKDFSQKSKDAGPVPRDLLPILANRRLEQDRVLSESKLATNVQEVAKPGNEVEASRKLQQLQEDAAGEVQASWSSCSSEASWSSCFSEAIDGKSLVLNSPEDGQIESSNPAKDVVHDSHGSPFRAECGNASVSKSTVIRDAMPYSYSSIPNRIPAYNLNSPLNPLIRPPDPVGPWMISNETTQRKFDTLPTAKMTAFECGLGGIQHYSYPRGSLVPFQTIKNLGRGSMAYVEEVYMPPYTPFVRKTFLLTMSSNLRQRCRDIIHREIQVMSRLTHMHIVQVIGSYDLEPITSTILMFPVGDNDLKMFLEELSEITPRTHEWNVRRGLLWKWVGCLTSAIAYIHSQGICHEDIKPSNIVHKGENVYLTDFSSCGQFNIGGTTSTGADARTTLVYRAPELFRAGDAGRHGPGTDVFALGLVFLEMKTVYWGTSIQHLRELYAAAAGVKSANTNEFYYGKALSHIHEELSRETHHDENKA